MLRKITGSFKNTSSILEKLKTSLPPVTLHPDGFEIKDRLSLRLSNLPRNIYSLSTIFKLMAFFLSPVAAQDVLKYYYSSLDHKNHYKFEGEGVEILWRTRDFYSCGTGVNPYGDFNIYEPVTPLWQGVDFVNFKYSAQLFRAMNEGVNSTIEACITEVIKDAIKKIQAPIDKQHRDNIIIGSTIGVAFACVTIAACIQHQRQRQQQIQAPAEDNSLTASMLPANRI